MGDLRSYLLVAGLAALLSYLLTPVVRAVVIRFGAVDRPGGRKMHAVPTPTLGGLALFLAFVGGLTLSSLLFPAIFLSSGAFGIAVGAALMVGLGIIDDLKGLSAPAKLAGQILAASVMTLAGVQVLFFWLPSFPLPFGGHVDLGTISLSPDLGVPLTVLVGIVTVNAINFVDGLDGLSAVLFGICVGFLPHNFNPARIFMGDTGSMLLGTLLSGATITGIGRTTSPRPGDQFALLIPVAIPMLVMALPFLDTLFAVGRRVRLGTGVMTADKNHLHYRLLEIGHSHRKAVLILWAWSALLDGAVVALSFTSSKRVLPVFLIVAACGIAALLSPRWRLRRPRGA